MRCIGFQLVVKKEVGLLLCLEDIAEGFLLRPLTKGWFARRLEWDQSSLLCKAIIWNFMFQTWDTQLSTCLLESPPSLLVNQMRLNRTLQNPSSFTSGFEDDLNSVLSPSSISVDVGASFLFPCIIRSMEILQCWRQCIYLLRCFKNQKYKDKKSFVIHFQTLSKHTQRVVWDVSLCKIDLIFHSLHVK